MTTRSLIQLAGLGLGLMAAAGLWAQSAPAPIVTPYARKGTLGIQNVTVSAPTVARGSKVEFTVEFTGTFDNPFDPADVALEARVRCPSGKTAVVPGFLYRPYNRALKGSREELTPAAEPSWRIRFTPTETGEHTAVVVARDRSGSVESKPVRFTAGASEAPGFIRISRQDRRYFAFDNGKPFFPIGANVCWAYGRGTFDYDEWFARYAEAGCNYARLWLSPPWTTFAIEQPGKPEEGRGLGQFDLGNAWRIDYVLDLAAARGIHLMLCIDSYNILREKDGYPQWDNTPHNAARGGPLQRPTEFWTSPAMDTLYRAKLRYLVARYGCSPAVMSWEFWNEADITTGYRSAPSRDWHARVAEALRALDPYRHLITTSFANTRGDPEVDKLPGLDYVQTHHYNSPDLAVTLAKAQAQKAAYGKPHIVGEIGADSGGPRSKDDPAGLQIHDPVWVSIATGGAGTAQPWWWDNNTHPRNLYHLYAAAARFTAGIDWPAESFRSITPRAEWPAKSDSAPTNAPPLLSWAIAGKQTALAWARVEGYTWKRVCGQKETVPPAPASVLVLPELAPGRWQVELWDTWKGTVVETKEITVPNSGEARLPLPALEKDVAVKLRRPR